MKYTIPYEVDAETPFAAIVKATELLRTGVSVEHVARVEASVPGWYFVDLEVSEPDGPTARLRDAISGERADWHKVEVDPADIAAVLDR